MARSVSATLRGFAPRSRARRSSRRRSGTVLASIPTRLPRKASGALGLGNDCSGWNEPTACADPNGPSTSSPRAPLQCTKATLGGTAPPLAMSRASVAMPPSGTVRKTVEPGRERRPRTSDGTPPRARTSCTRCPARRHARARLLPRLPRPATTRSAVGLADLRGGSALRAGRDRLLPLHADLLQLLRHCDHYPHPLLLHS